MAKVSSSFKCIVCKEVLAFPKNVGIVDFTILFLQFYKDHDRCEKLENEILTRLEKIEAEKLEIAEIAKDMDISTQETDVPHATSQSTES